MWASTLRTFITVLPYCPSGDDSLRTVAIWQKRNETKFFLLLFILFLKSWRGRAISSTRPEKVRSLINDNFWRVLGQHKGATSKWSHLPLNLLPFEFRGVFFVAVLFGPIVRLFLWAFRPCWPFSPNNTGEIRLIFDISALSQLRNE